MRVNRIRIEGYRNVDATSIAFAGLNALVALNSYGKSNILNAFSFACDFISASKDEKSDMMASMNLIPVNKKLQSKNFQVDFECELVDGQNITFVNYGYEFEWVKQNSGGKRIIAEWLRVKGSGKPKYTMLINRSKTKSQYKTTESGRCSNNIKIEDNSLIVNKLQAFDDLYYQIIIRKVNEISIYIERHLDSTSNYTPDPIVRKGIEELDIESIDNIPRTVYFLKTGYPDKYRLLEDAYLQLFPQIERIDVKYIDISENIKNQKLPEALPFIYSDKLYRMQVTDKNLNQPINFTMLSDGCKRVFLMLTFAVVADIKNLSIIAIEEPENSVHPALLQRYLRVLKQLANSCKIIVASHSPYIIECLNADDIYIGIPNDINITYFRKVAKNKVGKLIRDSSEYSTSMGSYLFDLLSGTQDDIDQLSSYLEK